jgi:hypothetical protein
MEQTTPTKTENAGSGTSGYVIGIVILLVLILIGAAYLYYNKNTVMPSVSSGTGSAEGAGATASTSTITATKQKQKVKVNDYVSGEAINKRQLSNYAAWSDLGLKGENAVEDKKVPAKKAKWDQYDAFWGAIDKHFGDPSANEPYVTGFMKGMNLAQKHDLVAIFKDEIQQYLDNDAKLPHWEVTKGQFLK